MLSIHYVRNLQKLQIIYILQDANLCVIPLTFIFIVSSSIKTAYVIYCLVAVSIYLL